MAKTKIKSSPSSEKLPVHPGCLPAWEVGEMPAPVPFGWKNVLALIGPGLVMVGGTIGTGEWVVGAGVSSLYLGFLLWVAPVAILAQVMLNTEAMRYTLVTGEPMFTGFMRSKPGPRFWLLWYLFLDSLSWMPALAGLAAQILLFAVTQHSPDPMATRLVSCGILILCGLLLCFGGKIYNTLEVVLGGKVIFVLVYLLIVTILFVPGGIWKRLVAGMTNPFMVPVASSALIESDLKDGQWSRFTWKLHEGSDPVSAYLRGRLSPATVQQLTPYRQGETPSAALKEALLDDLNPVITREPLYEPQRFSQVSLDEETRKLLEQNPKGKELVLLNRMLLGRAYPEEVPSHMPILWNLIGAIAGLAGIGGMGNILASNYVREKGWGMGAKVGAIPSAFGGNQITLANLGTLARPTKEAVRRFKLWWRYIQFDQFGLWLWGSIVGMLLPCLLGAAYLQGNYFQKKNTEWEAAARVAIDFGAVHGKLFLILTLLCGFIILFPGQFSSMDGIARRWCDAIWSGSRRAHRAEPHKVRFLYYGFVCAYVTLGIIINGFGLSAPKMMVFNANLANLAITCCIVHTLYVNTRFLPKEFQPGMAKRVGLVLAAVFYGTIFGLVTWQTITKLMAGTLFK